MMTNLAFGSDKEKYVESPITIVFELQETHCAIHILYRDMAIHLLDLCFVGSSWCSRSSPLGSSWVIGF